MGKAVSSFSDKGWITARADKADYLLAYFFTSDKWMCYTYKNQVSNLQALLQENSNDPIRFRRELEDVLMNYFSRYYDNASVTVSLDTDVSTSEATVTVKATVAEDGEVFSFGNAIYMLNGKFDKIARLNNTGEVQS